MKRVIIIVLTFTTISVTALCLLFSEVDEAQRKAKLEIRDLVQDLHSAVVESDYTRRLSQLQEDGLHLMPPRATLGNSLERVAKEAPAGLMWMGGSTIADVANVRSYPSKINIELWPETTAVVWQPGANFFFYYVYLSAHADASLVRKVHEGERRAPKVIVLIANPRMMVDKQDPDARLDNTAIFMPTATLPRNFMLPFYSHGLTIPQMLLSRASRVPAVRERLEIIRGARDAFQKAAFWAELGGRPAEDMVLPSAKRPRGRARFRAQWSRRIGPGNSTIRMIPPTIRAAHDWGAEVLVIGTPLPLHSLQQYGWFDETDNLRRLATVQAVVENAGGRYLNLHRALGAEHFRDRLDHYNKAGAQRMAELVKPVISEMLVEGE